jgi:hypothetical protein
MPIARASQVRKPLRVIVQPSLRGVMLNEDAIGERNHEHERTSE